MSCTYFTAMVGKGSPRLSMLARGSPKLGRMLAATSSAIKKRTASSLKGIVHISSYLYSSKNLTTLYNLYLITYDSPLFMQPNRDNRGLIGILILSSLLLRFYLRTKTTEGIMDGVRKCGITWSRNFTRETLMPAIPSCNCKRRKGN